MIPSRHNRIDNSEEINLVSRPLSVEGYSFFKYNAECFQCQYTVYLKNVSISHVKSCDATLYEEVKLKKYYTVFLAK